MPLPFQTNSWMPQNQGFDMLDPALKNPSPYRTPGTVSPFDTGDSSGGPAGMNPMSMASILGSLGANFAPQRFNRWGQKIPSWQENVGNTIAKMSQAQMMAKALSTPGAAGAGMNPLLLMMMMQGGK